MHWYLDVLKNYVGFSGRARRMEYWMFNLFNVIVYLILAILVGFFSNNNGLSTLFLCILGLYALGTLLPSIAVTIRRLHDSDRSGFWILINFVPYVGGLILLIFMCLSGTPGSNRFGDDPLAGIEE